MMDRHWIVVGNRPATEPHQHPDLRSARHEAERLAERNPGEAFTVYRAVGSARKVSVQWEPLESENEDDYIPF